MGGDHGIGIDDSGSDYEGGFFFRTAVDREEMSVRDNFSKDSANDSGASAFNTANDERDGSPANSRMKAGTSPQQKKDTEDEIDR